MGALTAHLQACKWCWAWACCRELESGVGWGLAACPGAQKGYTLRQRARTQVPRAGDLALGFAFLRFNCVGTLGSEWASGAFLD